MRHGFLFGMWLAPLAACSSSVELGGGAGTGAGANTSSSTTSSSTTSSTSSTTGSGGAGGSLGCVGRMDIAIDNDAPKSFATRCSGAWGSGENDSAVGYIFMGGPAPGVQALDLSACVSASPTSEGVFLSADDATNPGHFTVGSTTYTDASGTAWGFAGDPFDLVVSELEPVGGHIRGSFNVMVTHGGSAAHSLGATFDVCRVSDLLAP